MEKKIYVYENWSSDTPRKLGTLFIDSIRSSEHSCFQFDTAFLADACTSQMLWYFFRFISRPLGTALNGTPREVKRR